MLVLARKTDEQIQIGQDITLTILRIKGHTVKLGIQAPNGTHVLRGELQRQAPSSRRGPVTERSSRPEAGPRRLRNVPAGGAVQ